jgi:hypothetical protein
MSPLGATSAPSSCSDALLCVKQKKLLRPSILLPTEVNMFLCSLLVCVVGSVLLLFKNDLL